MKELILKIKEIKHGGFFKSGHILVNILERIDNKESDLGDFLIAGDDANSKIREIKQIGRNYKGGGYILRGDWNFD